MSSTAGDNSNPKVTHTYQAKKVSSTHEDNEVYERVFNILKGLRSNIVDYIILSVLDSMKGDLPAGTVHSDSLARVQKQLPEPTKNQINLISKYVFKQLEALSPATVVEIIRRIKSNLSNSATVNTKAQQFPVVNTASSLHMQPTLNPASTLGFNVPQGLAVPVVQPSGSAAQTQSFSSSVPQSSTTSSIPINATSWIQGTPSTMPPSGPIPSNPNVPLDTFPPSHLKPAFHLQLPLRTPTATTPSQRGPSPVSRTSTSPDIVIIEPQDVQPRPQPVATTNQNSMPASTAPIASPQTGAMRSQAASDASATQVPDRPRSPWTPNKANKSRLAQDIMRSLGRPRDTTAVATMVSSQRPRSEPSTSQPTDGPPSISRPLSSQPPASQPFVSQPSSFQPPTIVQPAEVRATPPVDAADGPKRKRTESLSALVTASPSLPKKQRRESPEVVEIATDGALELEVWQRVNVENGRVGDESGNESSAPDMTALRQEEEEEEDDDDEPERHAPVQAASVSVLTDAMRALDGLPTSSGTTNEGAQTGAHHNAISSRTSEASATAPPPSSSVSPTLHAAEASTAVDEEMSQEVGLSYEQTPLFLPSPKSSPGAGYADVDTDEDMSMEPFVLDTSLLGPGAASTSSPVKHKWKGRMRQILSDDELEYADPPAKSMVKPASSAKSTSRSITGSGSSEVFVLAPPLPTWAQRYKAREEKRAGKQVRRSRSMSVVIVGDEEDEDEQLDRDSDATDEERDEQEQLQMEAVQLSYTRLRESPCRWRGCGAFLNCTMKLIQHVVQHAQKNHAGAYMCEWQGCGRRFSTRQLLRYHLTKHASLPMYCAFKGCDRSHSSSKELFQHHNTFRHRNQPLKATPAPFEPAPQQLVPLPSKMPTYMAIPMPVGHKAVSKERHHWLGAQVLENIASFRWTGRRVHAGVPSRTARQMADMVRAVEEGEVPAAQLEARRRMAHDEYDGIAPGKLLRARCEDIPSGETTRLIDEGLVLFPPPDWEDEEVKEDMYDVELLYAHGLEWPAARSRMTTPDVGEIADLGQGGSEAAQAVADAVVSFVESPSHHQSRDEQRESLPGWTVLATEEKAEDQDMVGMSV